MRQKAYHSKKPLVNQLIKRFGNLKVRELDTKMIEKWQSKHLKEENTRLGFLNIEECQTLIDCCVEHLKPIVTVALHTGMRLSEVLNLKWVQVDLKHGFILLNITKNGERREIPIDNTLTIMFNGLLRGFESKYVFAGKEGNPY